MSEMEQAIARICVFEGLAQPVLQRLVAIANVEIYGEGDCIFREGDVGDKLYLVLDGRVRVSRNLGGMGEEAFAILESGDSFGEMSLVDQQPRSADAFAHEDCSLLAVSHDDIEHLMQADPVFAAELLRNFIKLLSARLRAMNDKMSFLSATSKF